MQLPDDIPALALSWHRAGRGAALATVVETWGSAPRPVGSQLVIDREGAMEGSVSGGCVEGAVVIESLEALEDGKARLLEFGVSDDDAFSAGLACGGRIRVLVEPVGGSLAGETLASLVEARAARRPVAYVLDLEALADGRIAEADDFPERFRADKSGVEEDGRTFVAIHNPPLRMIVVGAVHIAQPLVSMARTAGYDLTVIDPRPAFAAAARFPGQSILEDYPDEVMPGLGLDARTAVVTLTHDPKIDDPAIREALASEVFYLGCLGSKRTHAKRLERLEAAGYSGDAIARIHAPVGLAIGARSPAEIAISIMAEITRVLRQGA
ncbi:MAG TPA: XdhC family protein [Paracoccaceae bacterium]|nr:XdhC family protein [Paracoccaceae bacterium]